MWKQKLHVEKPGTTLSRELTLCRNTIQRIRKTLELLEKKHCKKTESVMEELRNGTAPAPEFKEDYDAWTSSYASLKEWEELEKQYRKADRPIPI